MSANFNIPLLANDVTLHRLELRRLRWRLVNGRVPCSPDVLPAALSFLDSEIAALSEVKG